MFKFDAFLKEMGASLDLMDSLLCEGLLDDLTPVEDGDEDEGGEMRQHIIRLYELQYKRVLVQESDVNPTIKEKVTQKIDNLLWESIKALKKSFGVVFQKWLRSHAITNPKEWAEARLRDENDESAVEVYGSQHAVDNFTDEYFRYKHGPNRQVYDFRGTRRPGTKFTDILSSEVIRNLDEFPKTAEALGPSFRAFKSENEGELSNFDEDYDGEVEIPLGVFDNYADAKKAVDEYTIADYVGFLQDVGSLEEELNNIGTWALSDMLVELYEKLVFPLWYGHWKMQRNAVGMNIDETRKNVQKVYEDYIMKTTGNLDTELQNVNHIIGTYHQNGSLLGDYGDIPNYLLKELSDTSSERFKKWKQDAEESGFVKQAVQSTIDQAKPTKKPVPKKPAGKVVK